MGHFNGPGRVSLPMYDRPQNAGANDRFYAQIRQGLINAGLFDADALPPDLNRDGDLWGDWLSPDLILSQTCGLPYRARLADRVNKITTPDYGLPGCPPGYYRSGIMVRADAPAPNPQDWPGLRLAINDHMSQSGWASAMNHAGELGTGFSQVIETGAHVLSARALIDGTADIAFVDLQTWRMLCAWEDWTDQLTMIGMSVPTPGLPMISAQAPDICAQMAGVIETAYGDLSEKDREMIGIKGFVTIPRAEYEAIATPDWPHQPG